MANNIKIRTDLSTMLEAAKELVASLQEALDDIQRGDDEELEELASDIAWDAMDLARKAEQFHDSLA